jgi:hypothetical protein
MTHMTTNRTIYAIALAILFVGCAEIRDSRPKNKVTSTNEVASSDAMDFPSFLKIISTGSFEERLAAYTTWDRASHERTDQNKALCHPLLQLRFDVLAGKASQEQFDLYCRIAEIMIKDFGKALENRATLSEPEILHYLRSELSKVAGNPYHTLELWAPVKKDYQSRQKWAKPKAVKAAQIP